jgi:hypothetical protein
MRFTLSFTRLKPHSIGAILTLTMLLELETKGQRLLPICVHTLYNLTCVEEHFKGMDRIAKALLNVTPTTGTALFL